MDSLIGKKAKGFKFENGPGYMPRMKKYNNIIGTIINHNKNVCHIKFDNDDDGGWSYPYPEILDYLVEEEQSIEEILNNIKNLTKDL